MYKNSDVFNIEKTLRTAKTQDKEKTRKELELALDAEAVKLVYNENKQLVYISTDSSLHKSLAQALAAKYIGKSQYITSIRSCWIYCTQGFRRITVYEDNGYKTEYYVKY